MKDLGIIRRMFYRDGLTLSEIERRTGVPAQTGLPSTAQDQRPNTPLAGSLILRPYRWKGLLTRHRALLGNPARAATQFRTIRADQQKPQTARRWTQSSANPSPTRIPG
jgi:hypothetical protein